MKKLITVLGCVFLIATFSTCDISSFFISGSSSPDNEQPNVLPPDQFVVGINSLILSSRELATIPGRNPVIRAIITPEFATEREIRWSIHSIGSVNAAEVAAINADTGEITVRTQAVPNREPLSALIRVESITDPSKYDTCVLTIYPDDYPRTREWVFSVDNAPEDGWPQTTAITSDIDLSDLDLDEGGTMLFFTGGGTDYTPGLMGPGVYVIDPENPFEYGPVPNGGALSSSATAHTYVGPTESNANEGTLRGFLYPNRTTLFRGHYRIGGSSQRVIRIATLFAPFTVIVNYRTNSAAEPRNADIRIGNTEGFRIEGPPSLGSGTGVNGTGAQTVWYSYDPTDPEKPEYGKDDIIPLVFIESIAGLQIYAVYVFPGVYHLDESGNLVPKP